MKKIFKLLLTIIVIIAVMFTFFACRENIVTHKVTVDIDKGATWTMSTYYTADDGTITVDADDEDLSLTVMLLDTYTGIPVVTMNGVELEFDEALSSELHYVFKIGKTAEDINFVVRGLTLKPI